MGFEFTSDMKTKEFCGATRPSEKLFSQRVERVTRKKYYDKSPNDRTVSTASYRSPAFTCRRMRCM
jgi:hypothetical protein